MAGNVQAGGLELVLTANAAQVVAAAAEAKAALQGVGTAAKAGGEEATGALKGIDAAVNKIKESTHEMAGVMRAIGHVMIPVEVAKTFFEIGTKIGEFLFKTKEQERELEEQLQKTAEAYNKVTAAMARRVKESLPDYQGDIVADRKRVVDIEKEEAQIKASAFQKDTYSAEKQLESEAKRRQISKDILEQEYRGSSQRDEFIKLLDLERERLATQEKINGAMKRAIELEKEQQKEKEIQHEEKLQAGIGEMAAEKLTGEDKLEAIARQRVRNVNKEEEELVRKNKGIESDLERQYYALKRELIVNNYKKDVEDFKKAEEEKSEAEQKAIDERKRAYSDLIAEQQYKQMEANRKIAEAQIAENRKIAEANVNAMRDMTAQMKAMTQGFDMSAFQGTVNALAQAVQRLAGNV